MNNKGTVSVEASIAIPIFLFTMLALIYIAEINTVKGVVYEAAIETTEYMAEYAYLTDCFEETDVMDYPMAFLRFEEYVDSKALLDKYIVGGCAGVSFLGSSFPDDEGYIDLHVTYYVKVNVPIIGSFSRKITERIRQRAYLGDGRYKESTESEMVDKYVYIADNQEAYHTTRSCSYLMPDIHTSSREAAISNGYRQCEYCGGGSSDTVYVTSEGECFHSSRSCSRLKRTVHRVKLSETGLPPCSRCAD